MQSDHIGAGNQFRHRHEFARYIQLRRVCRIDRTHAEGLADRGHRLTDGAFADDSERATMQIDANCKVVDDPYRQERVMLQHLDA